MLGVNKRFDLLAKLSALSPDIIMVTETYLDSEIADCEIVPANYTLYRQDRNRHGGGVLIAVSNKFTSVACPQFDKNGIELLWIQIRVGLHPVMFGVFIAPLDLPSPTYWSSDPHFSLSQRPPQFSFVVILTYQRPVGMICP